MTTYKYNEQVAPPGPFVHVSVRAPAGNGTATTLPAQVDSGADCTVLPTDVIEKLGLPQVDEIATQGIGGYVELRPAYVVELAIVVDASVSSPSPIVVQSVGSDGEPNIILGRDVLNLYHLVLDGPNRRLHIS